MSGYGIVEELVTQQVVSELSKQIDIKALAKEVISSIDLDVVRKEVANTIQEEMLTAIQDGDDIREAIWEALGHKAVKKQMTDLVLSVFNAKGGK